jgi:hypothetical protein
MEAEDLLNVPKGWLLGRRRGALPAAMAFVRICLANGLLLGWRYEEWSKS